MPPVFPAAKVELVAVINSFNRLALLREALTSLTAALGQCSEMPGAIVVYEAGSTDGSRDFLEQWAGQNPAIALQIIHPAPNAGTSFSDGVNAGCAEALRQFPNTRYLLLYETDNWIAGAAPLLQARELLLAQPDLAAAGWTVRNLAGSFVGYGMRFPDFLALAVGHNLSGLFELESPNRTAWRKTTGDVEWRPCDVVYTSPLLLRRSAWEQSGGFDAKVFPFTDSDLDWAWRCRRLGLGGQAVVRTEDVVHDNRAQLSAWSGDRVVKSQRSRLALLRRHRSRWGTAALKPVILLRRIIEGAVLAVTSLAGRPHASGKLAARLELIRTLWRD